MAARPLNTRPSRSSPLHFSRRRWQPPLPAKEETQQAVDFNFLFPFRICPRVCFSAGNGEGDRWRPICADEGRSVVVDDVEEEAEVSGGRPTWVLWEGAAAGQMEVQRKGRRMEAVLAERLRAGRMRSWLRGCIVAGWERKMCGGRACVGTKKRGAGLGSWGNGGCWCGSCFG
jgi:hypothetical protein